MRRVMVLVCLLSFAFAQENEDGPVFERDPTYTDWYQQTLAAVEQVCGLIDPVTGIPVNPTIDDIRDKVEWFCALQPTFNRVGGLLSGLEQDVTGFIFSALREGVGVLGDYVNFGTGTDEVLTIVDQGIAAAQNGTFDIVTFSGSVMNQLVDATIKEVALGEAALPANAPPLTKRAFTGVVADDVYDSMLLEEMVGTVRGISKVSRNARVGALAETLATTSLARGDESKLVEQVMGSAKGKLTGDTGTAGAAEQAGTDANSSRAAIQVMVTAQADFMRQQVVSDANLVTAVKEQAVQQALTTQQLTTIANGVLREQIAEYDNWRQDYIKALVAAQERVERNQLIFDSVTEVLGETPDD